MTNKQVVEEFLRGHNAKSGTLTSTGNKLFSYWTVIAEFDVMGALIVNNTKYSSTTSHHMGILYRLVELWGMTVNFTTKRVPYGETSLSEYL